jgi:hypothetical protein
MHGEDRGDFDVALINVIEHATAIPVKPLGGLWTSPVERDDDGVVTGTAWTTWCDDADFGEPARIVTIIEPDPTATVYTIDTVDDMTALAEAYPWPESYYAKLFTGMPAALWPVIDWPAMALDIDAVCLTYGGQWRTHLSMPGFNGWDCATVLWLQPRVRQGSLVELRPTVREAR